MFIVRPIRAEETHPLRQKILRPHQNLNEMVYTHDDHPTTMHLGGFIENQLVGVASVYNESMKGQLGANEWRLRGMAVMSGLMGQGFGRKLLDACLMHVRSQDGQMLWCNARKSACDFYEKCGFKIIGEEFVIKDIGPHFIMKVDLTADR